MKSWLVIVLFWLTDLIHFIFYFFRQAFNIFLGLKVFFFVFGKISFRLDLRRFFSFATCYICLVFLSFSFSNRMFKIYRFWWSFQKWVPVIFVWLFSVLLRDHISYSLQFLLPFCFMSFLLKRKPFTSFEYVLLVGTFFDIFYCKIDLQTVLVRMI